MPTCQWAIAQVTSAPIVGNFPRMKPIWRQKLRDALERKQVSMKALSKAAGLGETFVRDILERGRVPSFENAEKLCEKLDVPYDTIFGDVLPSTVPVAKSGIVEVAGAEFARIPVFDIRFAAGHGSEGGDEEPIDHYLVSMNLLRAATDAPIASIAAFQADGDSMSTTINNRDWVFVDLRRTKLTNPGIYALVYDGERFLKRVSQHLETRAVSLISDNPAYKPQSQTIKKPERLTVIGRVFMSIRRH